MANTDLDIIVRVRDATKAGFETARRGLRGLDDQAGRTRTSFKGLYGEISKILVTLGAGAFIGNAISTFKEFDDTMRQVGAVTGATREEMELLTKTAKTMGATTRFSASEAADGLRLLGMAGLSAKEATDALPGVLNLAAAGSLDLGTAADIATNVLAGFGLEVENLGQVNDVLVKTFTSSNTTLGELGEGFKLVGPIAKGLGADFEDLVGAMGQLGNAGLKGTLAGTALRGALNALFNPTKEEAKLMDDLSKRIGGAGLQIKDAQGNFIGFASIIEQLEKAGLKGEEALALFGQRAGPGMAALLQVGSNKLRDFDDTLRDAGGTAETIAEQMEAGIGGASREAAAALESLKITLIEAFGDEVVSGIREVRDWLREVTLTIIKLKKDGTIQAWADAGRAALDIFKKTIQGVNVVFHDTARIAVAAFAAITGDIQTAKIALSELGKESTQYFIQDVNKVVKDETEEYIDGWRKAVTPSGPIGRGFKQISDTIAQNIIDTPSIETTLKAGLSILEQTLKSEAAKINGEYDKGLITLDQYYEQRKAIIRRQIEAELELLRQSASGETDPDKKEAANAKIIIKQEELNTKLLQLSNERAKEEERLASELSSKQEALDRKRLTAEKAIANQKARLAVAAQGTGLEGTFMKEQSDLQTRQDAELQKIQEFHAAQLDLLKQHKASELEVEQLNLEQKAMLQDQADLQQQEKAKLAQDQEQRLAEYRLNNVAQTAQGVSKIFAQLYQLTGKKQKEFFYLAKAAAIAEATINIAQGVTKAIAQGGYFGIITGALVAAAGAIQIATIANQSLAEGGIVEGRSPSKTADDKVIRATSGEFVHNVGATDYLGRDAMDVINRRAFDRSAVRSALGLDVKNFSMPPVKYGLSRFQTGGEVSNPETSGDLQNKTGGGGKSTNIINVLDPAVFEQWSASTPGQRNILNVLSQNIFEVRQMVFDNQS